LLLDEPTSALDHIQRERLTRMLETGLNVPRPPAVLVISHDRDFLFSLCSKLYVMENGRIFAGGETGEMETRPANLRVAQLLGTHGWIEGRCDDRGFVPTGFAATFPISSGHRGARLRVAGYMLVPPWTIHNHQPVGNSTEPTFRLRVDHVRSIGAAKRIALKDADDGQKCQLLWDWPPDVNRLPTIGEELEVSVTTAQCHFVKKDDGSYHVTS
jgi:ABC-type sulfate/molybdate transport systems ATPase subunit